MFYTLFEHSVSNIKNVTIVCYGGCWFEVVMMMVFWLFFFDGGEREREREREREN